ncbi:hypothetical protein BU17DRAFT_39326, partial [Hysterangium stoloniferum]
IISMPDGSAQSIPSKEILEHVVDVHCHPTDSPISKNAMDSLSITICAMATKESDQDLVRDLASTWPNSVIPCFGYHPWFTHWIAIDSPVSKEHHYKSLFMDKSDERLSEAFKEVLEELPEPTLLSDVLSTLRKNLSDFPKAMLGEVGLDRAFRIPRSLNPDIPRKLSEFTVPLEHQMRVLEAQIEVAVELERNISFHSVKAQQATIQLIDRMSKRYGERWDMISLDMHSCGLSPEMWVTLERNHPNIYLSLSTTINARSPSHKALIAACHPSRILAESDYHDVNGSTERTWEMIVTIAVVKGWPIETEWNSQLKETNWGIVRKLHENWKSFSNGNHVEKRRALEASRQSRKIRKDNTWEVESNSDEN